MRITDYRGPWLDRYGSSPPSREYCRDCGEDECYWLDRDQGHPICVECEGRIATDSCGCAAPLWECDECPEPSRLTKAYYVDEWCCEGGHKLCG